MGKMKILALVDCGWDEPGLILNKNPELEYTKVGLDTIVGTDGTFHDCYAKAYDTMFKAFGGREFDLTMKDGEVVHCHGQWWSSVSEKASKMIGNVISVGINGIDSHMNCGVFRSYLANPEKVKLLKDQYLAAGGNVYKHSEITKEHLLQIKKNHEGC